MNNMDNKQTINTGITFTGMLAIVFITLKLCKVINWSWLWVSSPLWIPIAIAVLIFAIVVLLPIVISLAFILAEAIYNKLFKGKKLVKKDKNKLEK